MKETLRLHPPGPLLLPRRPSESCTVAGFAIPTETQIFVNVWAMHRDPEVWENPLEFQPERFLKESTKWDYSGNDHRYMPFGSGRRICPGISLMERMVPYAIATFVHMFKWRLPEGSNLDLSEKCGIVLKKETSLIVIPSPRFSEPELYH
ncbi:hypothetical protein GIB67_039370 [Kingdonia uniflora]|uniref:Cytochrome P450 n=1 Tax=Kingdonia uniflora TaxID=39325 RepID=A0A7J7LXI4_9MAGN|nr:hypothetical protein GIB67_039370 [Kingdonia uniflora]